MLWQIGHSQSPLLGLGRSVCRRPKARQAHVLKCLAVGIDVGSAAGDLGCFSGDLIQILRPMSQHPSLKGKGAIKAKRSVLKRFERVEVMKKRGQFKEGQRVIGLPKTKPEE